MLATRKPLNTTIMTAMIALVLAIIVISVAANGDVTITADPGTTLGIELPDDGGTYLTEELIIHQNPQPLPADSGYIQQLPPPNPEDPCFNETGNIGKLRLFDILANSAASINIMSNRSNVDILIRVVENNTWMATRMTTGDWWLILNPDLAGMQNNKVLKWLKAHILSNGAGRQMTTEQVKTFLNDEECFGR